MVARVTSERGEVVLRQRHEEEAAPPTGAGATAVLELRVNGVFVMDNAETSSEVALAQQALARVEDPRSVLVGGLGLGFTAHEVLADYRVERVTVAEIEEALVGWFRDGTVPHGPAYLADQRLCVTVADVRQVVGESPDESFDLVLLDVDNGPDFLVFPGNAGLYEVPFLRDAHRALRPGGVLAVWSSSKSERLATAVHAVFGDCQIDLVPVTLQGNEDGYWLHSARRSLRTSRAADQR